MDGWMGKCNSQLGIHITLNGEVVLHLMSLSFRTWPRMFYEHTL